MSTMYPKIDTLYERGEDFKVDLARVRRPEFLVPREWVVTEKIHGCNIRVSLEEELRSGLDPGSPGSLTDEIHWVVRFDGRKANSQMPSLLVAHLQDTFTLDGLKSLWRGKKGCEGCLGGGRKLGVPTATCECVEPYPVTLYGEGYGGGIQKGGGEYTSKAKGGAASFRLFDVLVGGTWLRRADVEDVAGKLGVKTVPRIEGLTHGGYGVPWDLEIVTNFVREGFGSLVAAEEGTEGHQAEGVVAFTSEPLYNNRGQRLMFKLKTEDFARVGPDSGDQLVVSQAAVDLVNDECGKLCEAEEA